MTDANELQRKAEEILGEARFNQRRTPGPFRGLFRWLGDRLEPIFGPIARFFEKIFGAIGDLWSTPFLTVVVVIAVVGFAILLSALVIRRRSAVAISRGHRANGDPTDPVELEQAAARAEAEGDFPEAVRLRFQAGVLRLQQTGQIRRGRSTPTRAIGRQLRIPEFDRLGATFDEVAYGGRRASASDVAESKRDWATVLVEAGRRS